MLIHVHIQDTFPTREPQLLLTTLHHWTWAHTSYIFCQPLHKTNKNRIQITSSLSIIKNLSLGSGVWQAEHIPVICRSGFHSQHHKIPSITEGSSGGPHKTSSSGYRQHSRVWAASYSAQLVHNHQWRPRTLWALLGKAPLYAHPKKHLSVVVPDWLYPKIICNISFKNLLHYKIIHTTVHFSIIQVTQRSLHFFIQWLKK